MPHLVNRETCADCGLCVECCPMECLVMGPEWPQPTRDRRIVIWWVAQE